MSNREALRRLSRKFPTPPEIEKIMDSLRDEKDLSVAIVAAAIVEASLERLLKVKFVVKRPNLMGQIFNNMGPLSDFHSKILVANAFGIITSGMADELHSIKTIRNTFAHAKMPILFDNELIEREINSLKMLTAIKNSRNTDEYEMTLSNKSWYLLVTRLLLIVMDGLEGHAGSADEAIKEMTAEKFSTGLES